MISRYKTDVIALLRPAQDSWSIEDWQAFFDERAGIAEYGDGRSRQEAEALASEHCVVEWLMRHPVRSRPGFCLGCGRVEDERGVVLPFGTEPTDMHGSILSVGQYGMRNEGQKLLALSAP